MSDALLDVIRGGVRVYDLGRPLFAGMPQSPNHPKYTHALPRRHGDTVRPDGGSAASDLLVMGTHVGTHIDALAHVSHLGKLHGGSDAGEVRNGGYPDHGVNTIAPMVRRGVLLDIPKALGLEVCRAAYEITPTDLTTALQQQGVQLGDGDVALIRSGWGRRFAAGTDSYLGKETGVPGVGEAGAHWLADRGVLAAGADTIAFEQLPAGAGHAVLPAHRVLLVDNGIYIIEALDLEELAESETYEFTFVLVPLNLIGATGSPVRPLAVVAHA
ncbi:cyclase family protein [Parafrigoribacterium mesophilum]|uniref:cyclase family protein n=1 Tax=Parafrigoribacterium mesophilum TaxID=433646 RepID=UPI0031FDA017